MNNAQIYGPPSHQLRTLTVKIESAGEGEPWTVSLAGYSPTCRTSLWYVSEVFESDIEDPAEIPILGLEIEQLVVDMLASRPNTQERAEFIVNGGLSSQPSLF